MKCALSSFASVPDSPSDTASRNILHHDEQRIGIVVQEAEDPEDVGEGEGAERFYSLWDVLWTVA